MKLLLENWREYEKYHNIFEGQKYITEILGISLPLNESGQVIYTGELREQIIKEHLLYESFIGSLINTAKSAAGKIKDLFLAIAKILKDSTALQSFISLLIQKVIKPIANQFRKAFNKVKAIGGKVEAFITKLSERFEAILQDFQNMASGWKKAMVGSTLALLLKYTYEKASGLLADVISGEATDEFVEWLQSKFAQMFGQDLLSKALEKIADIKTWLGWVGPLVGGVNFFATTLTPVTSRLRGNL